MEFHSPFAPHAACGPRPPPGPPPCPMVHGMFQFVKATLPERQDHLLQQLVNTLEAEGITDRGSLIVLSRQLLEQRLAQKCSLGQIADILTMQRKAQDEDRDAKRERQRSARGRSRSPRGRGRRESSRPLRSGGKGKGRNDSADKISVEKKDQAPKTRLWEAVEAGDEQVVQECINQGDDVNSTFKLWSPIMKAAEEGKITLVQMLSEARADLEATNCKGRSALSFAATPSMRRASQPEAVRALLTLGADSQSKDKMGLTAEDRLMKEKPEGFEETMRVFEHFSTA